MNHSRLNMNWKRKWLISLVLTFSMVFSTVGSAATSLAAPTATADTNAETELNSNEKTESESEDKTVLDSKDENDTNSEDKAEGNAENKDEDDSKDESKDESNADSENKNDMNLEDETDSDSGNENDLDSEDGTDADSEDETDTDSKDETDADSEDNSDADCENKDDVNSEDEADANSEDKTEADSKDEADKDSENKDNLDSKDETHADSENKADSDSADNAGSDSKNEVDADSEDDTNADSKDDANSESKDENDADSEDKNNSDSNDEISKDDLAEGPADEPSAAPVNPDNTLSADLKSDACDHIWSKDWSYDENGHWHECGNKDCPVTDNSEKDGYGKHTYDEDNECSICGYVDPASVSQLSKTAGTVPTYEEAYEAMIALKETYPEGMEWTNFKPYGRDGELGSAYRWNGGKIFGASSGVGCSAFAFILSDEAFENLPARAITKGSFKFEDVKVGDILRINNNSHSVIVLKKSAGGVIIAEANYNKSVHWGRAMSKSEVEAADHIITRYPKDYKPLDESESEKVIKNGTAGNLKWTLTNTGVLTISGSGVIPDYSAGSAPWNELSFNTVVIDKGVTGIGGYAFNQKEELLSIYIPDGVKKIGESAFEGSGLISVTVPGSVEEIGSNAFRLCSNLTSVTVSKGVKIIGNNAFRGCTSLAYIDFPVTITSVGDGAFASCDKMTSVRFMPGTGTVTMGAGLFAQCYGLRVVTLPQTADRISDNMFLSCNSLSRLYIPASVTEIGWELPFSQCYALKYLYFGGSEDAWKKITNPQLEASLKSSGTTVIFDAPFNNPFAPEPDDPGDLPDKDDGGTTPPDTGDGDNDHKHNWSTEWSHNGTSHWHECLDDCSIANNQDKNSYGNHSFGSWIIDKNATASQSGSKHRDCTICLYRQTQSIPATGSSGGNSDGSGDNPGGSDNNPGGSDNNPGGSDNNPGASDNNPGGSDNNPGGSNDKPGNSGSSGGNSGSSGSSGSSSGSSNKNSGSSGDSYNHYGKSNTGIFSTTINRLSNGSSVTAVTHNNGTITTNSSDAFGNVTIGVQLSVLAISTAQQSGGAVALPVSAVAAVKDAATAPSITVSTGGAPAKVAIPTQTPSAGTVAVIIREDGSSQVIRNSALTNDSIVAVLPDGATVKIVDNSKNFVDVPAGSPFENAVAFVSARELFHNTADTVFAPEAPMTNAMLITALARLDGTETDSSAEAGENTSWYTKSMEWAAAHGINPEVNPDGAMVGEDLITTLWTYMGSPAAADASLNFTDNAQVNSTQASNTQAALLWAANSGIISGFEDGSLNLQGQITRAQAAQIIMNLVNSPYSLTVPPTQN